MDHRSIGAYGLIVVILILVAAVVKWMSYHGAAQKGRRRQRRESREYADGKLMDKQGMPPVDEASDQP